MLRATGLFLALEELESLVQRLDAAMIIEGPTFAAFHPVVSRIGTAAGRPGRPFLRGDGPRARAQLEQFFVDADGAGLPAENGRGPGSRPGFAAS